MHAKSGNTWNNILVVMDPEMQPTAAFTRGAALAARTGAALTLLLPVFNPALHRTGYLDPSLRDDAVAGYLSVRRRWLETEVARLGEQGVTASALAVWHRPAYEAVAQQALERRPDLVIKDIVAGGGMFTPADWHLMRLCPAPLMLVNPNATECPQRILAAVDPFDTHHKPPELNDRILTAAATMAAVCNAPVHVAHVYQDVPDATFQGAEMILTDAGVPQRVRGDHRSRFRAFGAAHGIPEDRMHLVEGTPSSAIAALAKDINADLVVLGSVHRSPLERVLLGATAEEILDQLDGDVLVLKPDAALAALQRELGGSVPVDAS